MTQLSEGSKLLTHDLFTNNVLYAEVGCCILQTHAPHAVLQTCFALLPLRFLVGAWGCGMCLQLVLTTVATECMPDTPHSLSLPPHPSHSLPSCQLVPACTVIYLMCFLIPPYAQPQVALDMRGVPSHLLPLLPLFCRALTNMATESESFIELTERIGRKTGGLSVYTFTSPLRGKPDEPVAYVMVCTAYCLTFLRP